LDRNVFRSSLDHASLLHTNAIADLHTAADALSAPYRPFCSRAVAALEFSTSTKCRSSSLRSDTLIDPNPPFVDSDAIANLQAATGCDLNLPNLLLLYNPQRCCLNPTADHTVEVRKWLIEGFSFTSVAVQILANTRQSTAVLCSIYILFHGFNRLRQIHKNIINNSINDNRGEEHQAIGMIA
jgi:hypothetical protein